MKILKNDKKMEDDKNDEHLKIMNFLAITETKDQYIAKKYIQQADGNVSLAISNYMTNISSNNTGYLINEPIVNNSDNSFISSTSSNFENSSFIYQNIINPVRNILGCCFSQSNNEEEKQTEDELDYSICNNFENKVTTISSFLNQIKTKVGIVIFYTSKNILTIRKLMNKILDDNRLHSFITQKFILFPVLANNDEGKKIQKLFTNSPMSYPSIIFYYKYNNKVYKNIIFLNMPSENFSNFQKGVYDSLIMLNNINYKKNNNNNLEDISKMTDGEVLEKQKRDMENLENSVEKMKSDLLNKEKEHELRNTNIEQNAQNSKSKLKPEPEANDPNCTSICFRFPDGDVKKIRRFLKNDTIQNLYDFVASLGKEIYTEDNSNGFSLNQPFPPKKYENFGNTLEEEGLFPSAVIQIKEEE